MGIREKNDNRIVWNDRSFVNQSTAKYNWPDKTVG